MKKIIYLLFLSLFVFTSCNQEDEIIDPTLNKTQDEVTVVGKKSHDNRSVVTEEIWLGYDMPVFCADGTEDYLTGTAFLHAVYHYKDGKIIKRNVIMRGEATSFFTDEVFKIKEHDVEIWEEIWAEGIVHWRFNLKGNMGSHYIGYYSVDFPGWVITVEKILCK